MSRIISNITSFILSLLIPAIAFIPALPEYTFLGDMDGVAQGFVLTSLDFEDQDLVLLRSTVLLV